MLFRFVHGCDEVLFRFPLFDVDEFRFRGVLAGLVRGVQLRVGVDAFCDLFDSMKGELRDGFGCVEQHGFGYEARRVLLVFDMLKGLGFVFENHKRVRTGEFFPLYEGVDELNNYFKEEVVE